MNELGPEARSLLDAMLDADEPSAADAARVRTKIDVQLACAAGTLASATLSAKASASAGTAAGTVAAGSAAAGSAGAGTLAVGGGVLGSTALGVSKLALVIALGSGSVAAGISAYRANVEASDPSHVAQKRAERAASHMARPAPMPTPLLAPRASPSDEAGEEPVENSQAPVSPPTRAPFEKRAGAGRGQEAKSPERERRAAARAPSPPDSVLEEASLLETARAAIAQGNAGLALSQLDEHRARFPHGALREEARAARVLALCAGGRSREARAAALAFIADNPRSPLVAAMRGACAEPGPGSIVGPR